MTVFSKDTQALLRLAREQLGTKAAFVDPSAMAGGAPPGGDPSAAGGGDPSAAAGGAPPPSAGPDPTQALMDRLSQLEAQVAAGGGGGAGGAGAGAQAVKPKVDVNSVMLQILKVVCRIAEALNVPVQPSEMVPTASDLTQLSQMSQSGDFSQAAQPSSIAPIQPIQPAIPQGGGGGSSGGGSKQSSYQADGTPYSLEQSTGDMQTLSTRARLLSELFAGQAH